MPVYKDKKRNTWYIKININSKQFVKRGFKTKREALNDELTFRNECSSSSKKKKDVIITFDYLKQKYFAYRKNNLKPTSYYNLIQRVEKYISSSFDPNINVKDLCQHDFNRFRNNLSKSSLQNKNRIIKLLQDMFNYLDVFFDIRINYFFLSLISLISSIIAIIITNEIITFIVISEILCLYFSLYMIL